MSRFLTDRWIWQMAWRDSRSSRRRLFLFMSSIILGVAALVAISSFRDNLRRALDDQAKLLVGADLLLAANQPFAPSTEALIDSIGGDQSRQISFPSMIYFVRSGDSRLVQIRAVQGGFPYYGTLETTPPQAAALYQTGPYALVDDGLMLQFDAQPGDSVRIGEQTFAIAGQLDKIPGEAAVSALMGPRIYIPMTYVDRTNLLQRGSIARYRVYFKLDRSVDVNTLVTAIEPHLLEHRIEATTVESRRSFIGKSLNNVYHFLNLVGLVALLLGGVGVASAIHVYVKQKMNTVAILRCLGAQTRQIFAIYLLQAGAVGLAGAAVGALLGVTIQLILPTVFKEFLPVQIEVFVSIPAVLQGLAVGLVIAILFALLPLTTIRSVSPLLTLRSSVSPRALNWKDPFFALTALLVIAGVILTAISLSGRVTLGLGFSLAIGLVFLLLLLMGYILMRAVRVFFPSAWPYVWRQGLANLQRPNNQTLVLILSVGLGAFLVMTLYQTRDVLLAQLRTTADSQRPNLIFFDVQVDQKQALEDLLASHHLPVLQRDPIVTNRLLEINRRPVAAILKDPTSKIPEWTLRREYRSSYRDHLTDTEKLLEGEWVSRVDDPTQPIPVSVEIGLAKDMGLKLGDELVFDIQGVPLPTVVRSLRSVDWNRFQTNFFVIFPAGVLEDAPQFLVMTTRTTSPEQGAAIQRAVIQTFPNVSAIDLTQILQTFDGLIDRVAFVVRFMALFSIITGLTVLVGAVMTSRFQRIQESVLLRTLGATQRQIIFIMLVEYFFLGGLAAVTGVSLSLAGTWALAYFVFEAPFQADWPAMLIAVGVVILLTMATGIINSRGIHRKPPLEVLRVEV